VRAKPYLRYKPSGVEWLEDIPEHWQPISLKWISARYAGGTPDRGNDSYWDEGTIPWINSGAVNQGVITQPSALISEEGFRNSSAKWIPQGALVMALAGQGKTKAKVAQAGIRTTCNQSMAAIVPGRSTDARFIYWLLVAQYEQVRNMAGGEQRDGLNLDMLGSIPCFALPLDEQHAIADFLDRETAKIDTLVVKKRALVERLREKRAALISRTATSGLPPEAAGLDPQPKLKPSGIDWLGAVPEHWEVRKFSREVAITEGQVDPEVEPYASMLLIAPNHIESGTGRLIATETAAEQGAESGKYLCRKDEVVYSKIRPALAKVTLATRDCLCSADMYPMNGKRRFNNRYLCWLLLSEQFTAWSVLEADRVAMPKINRETLNELRLPTPPIAEQLAIADYLDKESANLDRVVVKVEEAVERHQEYRRALITAAVTGKIDVRSQTHDNRHQLLSTS
jgi:type I restriction enzyme S subunit